MESHVPPSQDGRAGSHETPRVPRWLQQQCDAITCGQYGSRSFCWYPKYINYACVSALATAIGNANGILPDRLDLFHCDMSPQGAVRMAEACARNTAVKYVNMSYNRIENEGAIAFVNVLRSNQHLEYLYLDHNDISDEGMDAVGDVLSVNQTLKVLWLSENPIGNHGIKSLMRGLCYNTCLESLHIQYVPIENPSALCSMLRCNRSLKKLWLGGRGTNMSNHDDWVIEFLRDGLAWNYYLQHIVGLCPLNDDLRSEMNFYLELNRAGRRLLKEQDEHHNVPEGTWPLILGGVSKKPHLLYYFLQNLPHLFGTD